MSVAGRSLMDTGCDASPILGCIVACEQCEFIARTLTAEQYAHRRAAHRSIGEHLRHCLEHFQLLLAGIPTGCVDYDARSRNEEIERSPAKFLSAMAGVISQLRALESASMGMALRVRIVVAPDNEKAEAGSTLGRELAFLSSHVIHQIAIATLLVESMGHSLPDEYGIAYSTSAHRSAMNVAPNGVQGPSSCAR